MMSSARRAPDFAVIRARVMLRKQYLFHVSEAFGFECKICGVACGKVWSQNYGWLFGGNEACQSPIRAFPTHTGGTGVGNAWIRCDGWDGVGEDPWREELPAWHPI